MRSSFKLIDFLFLIERNDSRVLVMNKTIAAVVISSIIDFREIFSTFKEVITRKQMPKRLDEAFRICGPFSDCSFIRNNL